jgi:hypothetical protein
VSRLPAADALALGGHLALAAGRRWSGRLRHAVGRPPAGLPASVRSLDAAWLTRVLAPRHPSLRVSAVRVLADEAGTTDRARLRVTYATPTDLPEALFVKTAPRDTATRLFVTMMGLGMHEVRFYDDLRVRLDVLAPRAFAAVSDRASGAFVLVLEDLNARGCRLSSAAAPCTLADALAMMESLARLHASCWDAPSLTRELAWMRAPRRHRSLRLERALTALVMARGVRRFPDLVPEAVRRLTPGVVRGRERLEAAWARGPLTVVHGDAHLGNTYRDGERVGLLDWQVVQQAQAMRDVTYFLCNSVPTDLRRAHERALIDRHRTTLGEYGVAPPSADDAWEQHRLHALYAWIAAAFTAGAATLQDDDVVRAGVARTAHAVLDLDAAAALHALD